VEGDAVDDFDHHSPEFAEGWRDIYRDARTRCPVIHSENHGGYYVLTRYEDVQVAMRDHKVFASARPVDEDGYEQEGGVAVPGNPFRTGFLEMDPPMSIALRRLINPWFNPKTVEAGRPRVRQIVNWAIDRVIERGSCDIVEDLASPVPSILILDILGIPLERWQPYGEALHHAVAKEDGSMEGIQWILGDIYDEVERQKGTAGDDAGLLATLTRTTLDGEPLDDDMVTELVLMILLGGMDTSIATLCHAMRYLGEERKDRQRLIEDPTLIPGAVEEMFRYYSPAPGMARTVLQPVTLRDHDFGPGDRVICSLSSANFDEDVFTAPDRVDIERDPNPHITFGTGTHRCIGADLARVDAETFLGEILRRMPDYELDGVEPYRSIPLVNGYAHLPARYPAGAQEGDGGELPALTAPRIQPA
jgi:cytochrome P450